MKFESLKAVEIDIEDGTMLSIQEDFGQEDDPELSVAGCYNPNNKGEAYVRLFVNSPKLLEYLEDMIYYSNNGISDFDTILFASQLIAEIKGEVPCLN